jgi:AraC-like DNA-binding protein
VRALDPVDTILQSVRLAGALLSRSELTEPWAVVTRGAPRPIFHAVVRGACRARELGGTERVELETGDVVVLPRGVGHVLATREDLTPTLVSDLRAAPGNARVPLLCHGGGGEPTVVVCGTFELEHEGARSLLDQMPRLVRLRPARADIAEWMAATLLLLDAELVRGGPGSAPLIARLTELLVMQLFRQYATSQEVPLAGWLAAVRDDQIGRALALIHGEPASAWSATRLARRVGLSRTRFFERFTELVGEPPARYLARWRASTAADLMRRRDLSIAELAELVGYTSENAFSRAFRKYVGVTPAEFRKRARS